MTNEHGVVIDDGVCARFADEHFYVSATTSGVDRVDVYKRQNLHSGRAKRAAMAHLGIF